MMSNEKPILKVENLRKQFGPGCDHCRNPEESSLKKNYCPKCGTVYACQDISFEVYQGEILGVVGESGSGKSTMMQCLYFDKEVTSGETYLSNYCDGLKNVFGESSQQKRYIRNNLLGKVYQNPMLGLKMDFSCIGNIAEKLIAAGNRNVSFMTERAEELLEHVNIPIFRMKEAPRNFSGGMQQRVQIAKALSNNPPILLLDEVTTGLDLSVQANVLDLIKKLQRELGISMLVVSHDLGVIRMLADRTIVMLNGKIVESGLTDQILEDPQHAYTQQLVQSLL
ncbi:ATP-binding cassette domain-containing protein [Clostridium butyricum]|nr:ATP-binding cassette domain-containing protein [Clostridium butyricum]MBC2427322.1 ATP-binding cassette domain-containing protein [Clostridium butyricum]MCQ2017227.1 ATP-binding cassette domain-containing protein [Clostridium butyricum]MCQ2021100.1 ATP-binding cassette domain-containing protein [Clostridium butyricum]NFB73410.1 ATP-binding cassette domain-containing protein [Clostridium butyricum]